MKLFALAITLFFGAQKGHVQWLNDWVAGEAALGGAETVQAAEAEARRRAHSAWREGDPKNLELLRKSLEAALADARRDEGARLRACRALGWLRQTESVPALATQLAGGAPKLREEAAAALRHFGTEKVKYAVVTRTGLTGTLSFEAAEDPRATAALAKATRDAEPRVRRAALKALLQHEGVEVISASLEAARANRDVPEVVPLLIRVRPAELEKLLLGFTTHDDEVVRASGARGLGLADLQTGKKRLLELLDDPAPRVFAAAHSALRRLEGFPPAEMPETAALDRALLTAQWRARLR
jgi:HEAT repeat protein